MFRKFNEQLDELEKQMLQNIKIKIDKTLDKAHKDIQNYAPTKSGRYRNSIKKEVAKIEGSKVSGKIYSKLKIGGKNAKWANRKLGFLLEYGTGPAGKASVSSDATFKGLTYRKDGWWFFWEEKGIFVYTKGMPARPHFKKGLEINEKYFLNQMKGCTKKNG